MEIMIKSIFLFNSALNDPITTSLFFSLSLSLPLPLMHTHCYSFLICITADQKDINMREPRVLKVLQTAK